MDAKSHAELATLRAAFKNPDRQYTQVPLWFWNDKITLTGIRRQIRQMEEKHVFGFVIHPRIGLSKKIGYMTTRWLNLVRAAVEEAEARKMFVYLYDEAMYPSGSAHGRIVHEHPQLASQGLRLESHQVVGPQLTEINVVLAEDETIVAITLMQQITDSQKYVSTSTVVLPNVTPIRTEIPGGEWTIFLLIQSRSNGRIRGIHWDEDDDGTQTIPSADLLNPETTTHFITETHDRYYALLGKHFGHTIKGIFTDEPTILGRRPRPRLVPWSGGLLAVINAFLGYDLEPYLPFLWIEAEDGTEVLIRRDFSEAISEVLNRNYYSPLSEWCQSHGVALTGHPAASSDLKAQLYFQEPGQDVVWRYVTRGKTSLEGKHSVLGKTASSAGVHLNCRNVINECFGAYGWNLTMNEVKWLTDWLFVRGTTRLMPHAFYYSVRGRRIFDRPPDLGWHNFWWGNYEQFSRYTNRLSWLFTDCKPVTDIAILAVQGIVPWRAAKYLYQNQRDFFYLDDSLLAGLEIQDGRARLGRCSYIVILLDSVDLVTKQIARVLKLLVDHGVHVIALDSPLKLHRFRREVTEIDGKILAQLREHERFVDVSTEQEMLNALDKILARDVHVNPPAPDLRTKHVIKGNTNFYFLVNEGEDSIRANVGFNFQGIPEAWNAETGETRPIAYSADAGGISIPINLVRGEATVVSINATENKSWQNSRPPNKLGEVLELPNDGWTLNINDKTYENISLGSWTTNTDLELFSGTGCYELTLILDLRPRVVEEVVVLDCGVAKELISVKVNGESCGSRLWGPYRFDITKAVKAGNNNISIAITNTRANQLMATSLPSGLFGPVRIQLEMGRTKVSG